MAAFPFYPMDRLTHIRIPGVLQRIGVAYTCAALISMRTTLKQQVGIVASLLFGYWFVMTLVPVPGAMGGIGYKSSYRSVHEPAEPTSTEGPGCCSTPFGRDAKNPLTRLRGDD